MVVLMVLVVAVLVVVVVATDRTGKSICRQATHNGIVGCFQYIHTHTNMAKIDIS